MLARHLRARGELPARRREAALVRLHNQAHLDAQASSAAISQRTISTPLGRSPRAPVTVSRPGLPRHPIATTGKQAVGTRTPHHLIRLSPASEPIVAGASEELVLARAADQSIVAGASEELVLARAADQSIVAGATSEDIRATQPQKTIVPALAADDVARWCASQKLALPRAHDRALAWIDPRAGLRSLTGTCGPFDRHLVEARAAVDGACRAVPSGARGKPRPTGASPAPNRDFDPNRDSRSGSRRLRNPIPDRGRRFLKVPVPVALVGDPVASG